MWHWLQDKLGIKMVLRRIDQLEDSMSVDRTALVKTLTEIGEAGNKIAAKIDQLVRAQQDGAQNEVNRLVQELAPTSDFLRALASDPTENALNEGGVVPDLAPVGGEPTPAQDPVIQDAVAENQSQL